MNYNIHEEVLVKLLKEKPATVHKTSAAVAPPQCEELNPHLIESKPVFYRGNDSRDEIKYAAKQRAKEIRRSKRNRRRASLKPQGLEDLVGHIIGVPTTGESIQTIQEGTMSWPGDLFTRMTQADEGVVKDESYRKRWVDEVISMTKSVSRTDQSQNLANVIVRLFGFLTGLALCQSQRETRTLTFTLLSQYFDIQYLDQIYDWCMDGELIPQADCDANQGSFERTSAFEHRKFMMEQPTIRQSLRISKKLVIGLQSTNSKQIGVTRAY